MLFLLVALHLRDSGKIGAAAGLTACALLSKETAAVAIPVLIGWDFLMGRRPARLGRGALWFGAMVALWFAIHPGLRALASAGFQSGSTGYVGLERPERWWEYLVRYGVTLLNFPVMAVEWPGRLTVAAVLAVVALLVAVPPLLAPRVGLEPPPRRLQLAALFLALLPILPLL